MSWVRILVTFLIHAAAPLADMVRLKKADRTAAVKRILDQLDAGTLTEDEAIALIRKELGP
jgi:predicted PP-loop superfamily ATPase